MSKIPKNVEIKLKNANESTHVSTFRSTCAEHVASSLLSLNIDCCEEIFDYLPLEALHAMSQTCKRMQQIAGAHFHQIYQAAHVVCQPDGIYTRCIQINGFIRFIRNISFYSDDMKCFRYINSNHFDSLERIRFCSINLTDKKIACLRNILAKVETVEIFCCTMTGEFYEKFLSYCTNLKRLTVKGFSKPLIGTGNDWLLRTYPTLQHLELTSMRFPYKIDELETFFRLNLNIRSFAIDSDCLWINVNSIMMTEINLDILAIDSENCEPNTFYQLLNTLHAMDFYKQLHFYALNIDEESINQIASMAALEKLYTQLLDEDVVFPTLTNLKELCIGLTAKVTDMDTLAKGLVNLERICFLMANLKQIVSFIRHSVKLTKIKVKSIRKGKDFDANVLDLLTWNKEREKLAEARKIMVYVEEDVYLATKWALRDVNYSMIELRRIESHESNHDFGNL